MSKLGTKPILIPEEVKINLEDKNIKVSGPKGELECYLRLDCEIKIEEGFLRIIPQKKDRFSKSLWGLTRTTIKNMVEGVRNGFEKKLELVGVGFRAGVSDNKLTLNVGFSHSVEIEAPEGIEFKVEKNKITVSGIDKQKVGEVAAKIRAIKKPEPYKGKGIKYESEVIKRKPGKTIAKIEGTKA